MNLSFFDQILVNTNEIIGAALNNALAFITRFFV